MKKWLFMEGVTKHCKYVAKYKVHNKIIQLRSFSSLRFGLARHLRPISTKETSKHDSSKNKEEIDNLQKQIQTFLRRDEFNQILEYKSRVAALLQNSSDGETIDSLEEIEEVMTDVKYLRERLNKELYKITAGNTEFINSFRDFMESCEKRIMEGETSGYPQFGICL